MMSLENEDEHGVRRDAIRALQRRGLTHGERAQIGFAASLVASELVRAGRGAFAQAWERYVIGKPELLTSTSVEEAIAAMDIPSRGALLQRGLLREGGEPHPQYAKKAGRPKKVDGDDDTVRGEQRRGGPALPARVPPGTDTLSA